MKSETDRPRKKGQALEPKTGTCAVEFDDEKSINPTRLCALRYPIRMMQKASLFYKGISGSKPAELYSLPETIAREITALQAKVR